jgi:predicted nucleic acid-binding protein
LVVEKIKKLQANRKKTVQGHSADMSLELRQAGRPIPANDIWIAALCRQHELPLLSRDRHFDTVSGIQPLEW